MGFIYEERATTEQVVIGGLCDHCDEPIKVNPDIETLNGASIIEMHGWYGGWYDPGFDEPNHAWVLCQACSEAIFLLLTKGKL